MRKPQSDTEYCDRCGDPFRPDDLNGMGLCAGCEDAEAKAESERSRRDDLRVMSNDPYED